MDGVTVNPYGQMKCDAIRSSHDNGSFNSIAFSSHSN